MRLIAQSAWLALCKCAQHGVITFGDGSSSEEFFSKKAALVEVETAVLAKKIISAEAELLREEIARSAIPTEDKCNASHDTVAVIDFTLLKPAAPEEMPQPSHGHTLH
jgi:hypothetical protein